jgi:hypothetical protein
MQAGVGKGATSHGTCPWGRPACTLPTMCRTHAVLSLALSSALALAACDAPPPGGDPDAGGGEECTDEPCLPPPENGFQVRSVGTTILPGQDVEYCEVVQLPGTPDQTYYVNRFESAMTLGSHHLIVEAIVPDSSTEAGASPGDRKTCVSARQAYGNDLVPVTGQQLPYHEESYPEGVGRVYRGGQLIVFDYHYFNASDAPLQARAAVNFHTVDASRVERIVQSFGFFNFFISTPPGETRDFTKRCNFSQDVMLHKLTRHTHQWGTDFSVWFAGGDRDGQLVWSSPNYETDLDYIFAEPILVKAGDGFTFRCTFENDTDQTLTFGTKATDEMCILFGQWFTVGVGEATPSQSCT